MTRRSFLFLAGAGTAGLLLAPEVSLGDITQATYPPWQRQNIAQLVAEEWNRIVGAQLRDNLLVEGHFARLLAENVKLRVKA